MARTTDQNIIFDILERSPEQNVIFIFLRDLLFGSIACVGSFLHPDDDHNMIICENLTIMTDKNMIFDNIEDNHFQQY